MKKLAIFVSGVGKNTASRGFSLNSRERYLCQTVELRHKDETGEIR